MKLTAREEAAYLIKILNGEYNKIDHGSSRAVYELDDERVIKLALQPEGRVQNQVEIEMFKTFGDTYLARIYNYGESIIIMEKVDIFYKEIYDFSYDYLDDMAEFSDLTDDEIEGYSETVRFLDLELGETSDNTQLGFRYRTGTFVSYDYGYISGKRDISVGYIYQFLRDEEAFSTAIQSAIEMLGVKK